MTQMKLSKLAELIGGQLEGGQGGCVVKGLASLESAQGDEVAFLANAKYERFMAETKAAAVIVSKNYAGSGPALIRCDDAYFAYRQAMVTFYGFRRPEFSGIDNRANIDATAKIAGDAKVGAFATVSAGCEVGSGTVIYPGVYVGPRCHIGSNCTIYSNVTLYDGSILHNRVTIHAGSSIGQDGFGYATHQGGDGIVRHEKIPQAGWVELEDDVEIGACCAIDRATMGPTVIGAGTKFSNLIAIGHGTKMGKHCLMVAQAGIAGSTMVGNYCVFAGQAGVVGHIRIGDGVKVGAQSGVTNDVPAGQEVLGSPAMPLTEGRRVVMSMARLPQLRTAVRKLTDELHKLKKHFGGERQEGED